MWTARLIRLGRCLGWSESSLGPPVMLFFLSCFGWKLNFPSLMRYMYAPCILADTWSVANLPYRWSKHEVGYYLDRVKWIWYLSPMRAAMVQASLRIRAVSPEPPLLAHTSSESRGTFRQKARSLAPLNGWACAVKICHDGMLKDTNSLDGAHLFYNVICQWLMPTTP